MTNATKTLIHVFDWNQPEANGGEGSEPIYHTACNQWFLRRDRNVVEADDLLYQIDYPDSREPGTAPCFICIRKAKL